MHPNVWVLMIAQSFVSSIGPLVVFVGGFIGLKLAPSDVWATLPVACMVVGVALFMLPTVGVLSKVGRKNGFKLALLFGVANCGFTAYSITMQSFSLFCLAIALFGVTLAASLQFRFAALESVDKGKASQAISILLMAGLVAAFLGPEAALWGKDLFQTEYVGSFLLLAGLLLIAFGVVHAYQPVESKEEVVQAEARPLPAILSQPVFFIAASAAAIAFSVMSFVMTATPISMHVHHGFSMEDTKWVIQSHVIAMYLPSLVTGKLIHRFGIVRITYVGIAAFAICMGIGLLGQAYVHYWCSLVLLGVGWNFMFVAATTMLPLSYKPAEKFKIQGINDFIVFSAQATASLSAGWVIKSFGWNMMLVSCLLPLGVITLMLMIWRKQVHQGQSHQQADNA